MNSKIIAKMNNYNLCQSLNIILSKVLKFFPLRILICRQINKGFTYSLPKSVQVWLLFPKPVRYSSKIFTASITCDTGYLQVLF